MRARQVAAAVGLLVALVVVLTVVGFAAGWFRAGVEVISPANVKEQWAFAYSYDRSLGALAGTWCSAKTAEVAETNPDYRSQRTTQRLAYENQYRNVEAQYDAALANAFKAKLVKPSDVPVVAPTLDQKIQSLGLRCG